MGSNVQVQVSSSKGSGIAGFGFQVLGFRLRMSQFAADFALLNEVKHLLWGDSSNTMCFENDKHNE
ncbi:MAG: hypothetical protein DSY83_14315 [Flavobacteriia bacterium]|nr:MAG: hypothetical protein DSY83_14315 [Flavobacteriia bacterium]